MKLFICNTSALEYLRKTQAATILAKKRLTAVRLPFEHPGPDELSEVDTRGLELQLHVLVGENTSIQTAKIHSHSCSLELPPGSFIRIDDQFAVSSPELCYLQMANVLSLPELVALGYELCGSYRKYKKPDSDRGFEQDLPLTSVAKLSAFLTKTTGMNGHKKATKALRYIVARSASPMETAVSILLTLPFRLGGFNLPLPMLNISVSLALGVKWPKGIPEYRGDLCWPQGLAILEYNSDAYHLEQPQIKRDTIRRNYLTSIGVSVITVTRGQINRTDEFQSIAEELSRLLGRRLRYPLPEFKARQAQLRSIILPKLSAGRE